MARYDKHTWVDGELITALLMNHHEEALKNFAENIIDIQNIEDKIDASVLHIVPDSLRIVRYDELTDWDHTGIDKNAAQATARINIDAAALQSLASEYNIHKTYAVGDYCSYNNKLYCCKVAIGNINSQEFEVSNSMEVNGDTIWSTWMSEVSENPNEPTSYQLNLSLNGATSTDLISITNITAFNNDLTITANNNQLKLTYYGENDPGSVIITGILYHTGINNGTITIEAGETSKVQTPAVTNTWNSAQWDEVILTDKLITLAGKTQLVTTSSNGLMSSSDKSKLDEFLTASNYALKTEIDGIYKYIGSVSSVADLPSTEVEAGDVYNVVSDGMNYAWTGTEWDALGTSFTLPTATSDTLGGIKIGNGLSIDSGGAVSVTPGSGLPAVTSADNNSQLMVINGQWELVTLYESAAGHYF